MPNDEIMGSLYGKDIEKNITSVQIANTPIEYLHTSTGKKKKAIIFVHGSPGSLDAFLKYMHHDSLLHRADLISYDRPGYGNSSFGTAEPSLRTQAYILSRLMDHLDYQEYWLVGHSYGASVVLETALVFPQRIKGIGLIAGSVNYHLEPKGGWRKWINLPLIRELLPISLRVSNEELITLRSDLRMIEDDWEDIRVPVSLMHGTKDKLVAFENLPAAQERLVNADTVRTLIFEEESHFLIWNQREQVVKEILALMETD
jgi:pimeloyl-ACP methyl ester carboxylesterase